jgi:hypothetical protein
MTNKYCTNEVVLNMSLICGHETVTSVFIVIVTYVFLFYSFGHGFETDECVFNTHASFYVCLSRI